jgi:hypothetical protein
MHAFPHLAGHAGIGPQGQSARAVIAREKGRKLARERPLRSTVQLTMEHGLLAGYAPPEVKDYGTLREMTAAAHLFMGAAHISDLSFSSPLAPGGSPEVLPTTQGSVGDVTDGNGPAGGSSPGSSTFDPGGGSSGGSPGGGSSGGGSSGGGGGHLPFTGFAAGVAAAIGSALAAGGTLLRRASRPRRPD